MKFEKLSKTTLKVILNTSELSDIGISHTDIASDNDNAKQLLCRLILLGAAECGFEPDAERYTVEVFSLDSCYIIYISSAKAKRQSCNNAIMCKTESIEDIVALSNALCSLNLENCRTMLYSHRNEYLMVAKCGVQSRENIKNIFSEFGTVKELSRLELAELCERQNILFEKKAAESIKHMFRI